MIGNTATVFSPFGPRLHALSVARTASSLSILLLVALLLAGCGARTAKENPNALMVETQNIALAYQAHGDLERARADLAELDVVNPDLWLLLTAETAIAGQNAQLSQGGALALARLAYDAGLRSTALDAFVQANNLLPALSQADIPPPAPTSAPQAPAPSPTPTASPVPAAPTATATATVTPVPAATQAPTPTVPQAVAQGTMNVRGGPGTGYAIVASIQAGATLPILGRNPAGDWWQVQLANGGTGWVFGALVDVTGNRDGVAVAANIPTPPPTNTPAPVAPTVAPPPPVAAGPDFRLVERRLWTVEETGGHRSGTSVNCSGALGLLRVIVLDANSSPLNGVTIKGVGRFRDGSPDALQVTGSKGPGIAEYDVNTDGDDLAVARDVDGREVSSDVAYGNTGRRQDIPFSNLIQAGYCTDEAHCAQIAQNDAFACHGHYSWTVIFQRAY